MCSRLRDKSIRVSSAVPDVQYFNTVRLFSIYDQVMRYDEEPLVAAFKCATDGGILCDHFYNAPDFGIQASAVRG